MSRLPLASLLIAGALALAACGDDTAGGPATTSTAAADAPTTSTATGAQQIGCEQADRPKARKDADLAKPTDRLDAGKRWTAKLATSCGDFTIRLAVRENPKTTSSFAYLARKGFYDGLAFHRIIPGFVAQGGDPLGNGQGGPGYTVVEAPPQDTRYTKGTVAMAKTQVEKSGTSGSQFFVVTGEDAMLPPDYAVVGKVTKGLGVVDRIGSAPVQPDDQPVDPIVIRMVTIKSTAR